MPKCLNLTEQKWQKIAIFVAHPDDETFCSGLIKNLTDSGANVSLYCLTRGEGGPTGGVERSELGAIREQEMHLACAKLGISEVEFLDHIDPLADAAKVFAPDVSSRDLATQISPYLKETDLVLSHGSNGEYWHPAHLLVFDAVKKAITGKPIDWITFLASDPDHPMPKLINENDPATYHLDVSEHEKLRTEALACHSSQLSLFGKFADGSYEDFIKQTSRESYCLQQSAG